VDLHVTLQARAIFDGDPACIDVAHNGSRFLQLSALEAVQGFRPLGLGPRCPGMQVGADTSVRPDSKATVE
jgi:hypothetical protein